MSQYTGDYPLWDSNAIYDQDNTIVAWNDRLWYNKWWTSGDEPGISSVWEQYIDPELPPNPEDIDEWGNYIWRQWVTYNTNDIVSHNNKLYRALWNNYGVEPDGTGPWESYQNPELIPPDPEDETWDFELGAYFWQPIRYDSGFIVSHVGSLWKANRDITNNLTREPHTNNRWDSYDPEVDNTDPNRNIFLDEKIWVDGYIWREYDE